MPDLPIFAAPGKPYNKSCYNAGRVLNCLLMLLRTFKFELNRSVILRVHYLLFIQNCRFLSVAQIKEKTLQIFCQRAVINLLNTHTLIILAFKYVFYTRM